MIKQIFLFSLSFLLILISSEIFIRTSKLECVSSTEYYNDIGRGRRKNFNYVFFNEGFGIGRFNEYRYIGEPNPPQKSNNTIRIALMGDSYVESFQIFERDYFGVIAENYLGKKYPEKNFEFLNFGRSGFDIADIYSYQKIFVEKFNPDFILYMISYEDLDPKYSDPLVPRTFIENDSLIIDFNFKLKEIEAFEKTKFLTQNSSTFNMLNNCRKKTKKTPMLAVLLDKIYFCFNDSENKLNLLPSELIEEYQINPVTTRIVKSLDINKVIIVNRDSQKLPWKFEEFCLDNGLKYFDLSEILNLMKKQGNDPNEWKITKKRGHWNQKANKIVGEEIAKIINKLIDYKTVNDYNTQLSDLTK